MTLLIVFFLISITFSFLCSIWEAVLLSITPSYARIKLKEGGKVGELLKEYKDPKNIDRPLSAILTLNTIAHTVGAMGVGAQAEKIWASESGIDFLGLHVGSSAIIGTVMTLAILILSEIIPKTLGANYWKQLTPFTVRSLSIIITILSPLVWVSQLITKALKKEKSKSVLSRADFTAMAELGEEEGVFDQGESKILQNLLSFNYVEVKHVMTPRTVVKAAEENTTINDFYAENKELHFSRIPLYKDTQDNINGYILKDEMLASIIDGNGDAPLGDIRRELKAVKTNAALPDVFSQLMENREHIALAVDEFGTMAGIVTMEDIIETLLGMEIVDEMDGIEDMQALARKKWETRAKNLGIIGENEPNT